MHDTSGKGTGHPAGREEYSSPAELIGTLSQLLTRAGYSMATAESCTGGMIAALCTDVAGSSAWFKGGVVSYANEIKENLLGVPSRAIAEHGAVSGEVVRHMAVGALHVCSAQAAVAVSGVAGPGGGQAGKPVGTVWTAVAVRERPGFCQFDLDRVSETFPDCLRVNLAGFDAVICAARHHFNGDRAAIRRQAALKALHELTALLQANTVG